MASEGGKPEAEGLIRDRASASSCYFCFVWSLIENHGISRLALIGRQSGPDEVADCSIL